MTESRDVDDDPYAILGISRTCTPDEVKRAYHLLARRCHPDVNPGPEAVEQMARINRAYGRVLRQIERMERIRAFQTAPTATTLAPAQHPLGRAVPPKTRRRVVRLSIAASAGLAALVLVLVARALQPQHLSDAFRGGQTSQGSSAITLQLGSTVALPWTESGAMAISERLLAPFSADMRLNEAPQWSRDATYVAISVTSGHSAADATGSTILVLRGVQVLARLPASSGRWSPVADQLAVLTAPTAGQGPRLELVSPDMTTAPLVLDTHGGNHLAWSDDGARIAYSADGQQQLRLATVAQNSHRVLVKARGQLLSPVGWQGDQIVEIVRNAGSTELVAVDSASGRATSLAPGGTLTTDATVAVSRGGITYLSQPPDAPFVTLHWSTAGQRWQAQLLGIQTVRLLTAWSGDGTWIALAPPQSGKSSSVLCLAHTSHAGAPPPTQWPVHCLRLPGVVVGMSWEPLSNTLSYIRAAQPGGGLELRELRIQPAQAHVIDHAPRKALVVSTVLVMLIAAPLFRHLDLPAYVSLTASGQCPLPLSEVEGDP